MNNKIIVNHGEILNDRLVLSASYSGHHSFAASGRMLVDSEGLAFIYILETEEDGYVYLSIPSEHWTFLKETLDSKMEVELHLNKRNIHLSNFAEELEYLISNIEGNLNYGEEMVKKVEALFLGKV